MRSITFNIGPGLELTLSEQMDGSILFELEGIGSLVDIRGLFFDVRHSSLLGNLVVSGEDITSSVFIEEGVKKLGPGVNMNGTGVAPFDAGIGFGTPGVGKDEIHDTQFTLSTRDGTALTLDELAHVDFGVNLGGAGGKAVTFSPAAPNAFDDVTSAPEDQSTGLTILANDTDEDVGDILVVTSATDPAHGTVQIATDGKSVIYVSDPNYSGPDSFSYSMSDGNGGKDTAKVTVDVIAVADAPNLSVEVSAGNAVNEIKLRITSSVTDTDGSEFIDRLEFAGLPPGTEIIEALGGVIDVPNAPGVVKEVTLVLAPGFDYKFDLAVKAISKEASNGDEEAAVATTPIDFESNTSVFNENFIAQDQNVWGTGNEFNLPPLDEFIGIDEGFKKTISVLDGLIYAQAEAFIKAGLDVDIAFNGGNIDAHVPIDITFDTSFNHTTDMLVIDASAIVAAGGGFSTVGPSGHAMVDFIFEYGLGGAVGLDLPLLDPIDVYGIGISGNHSENLIDANSADLSVSHEFPFGIEGAIAWPNVTTTGVQSGTAQFSSMGASNDFLSLTLDVDQALADVFLGGANPFEISAPYNFAIVDGTITLELLDLDLSGGVNFLQNFDLLVNGMTGTLTFENGAPEVTRAFNFVDNITLTNASSYDTDNDGMVEFAVTLTPTATLENTTEVNFHVGYNFDLVKGSVTYDPIIGDAGAGSFGPVVDLGGTLDLAAVPVFDEPAFAFNFQPESVEFFA